MSFKQLYPYQERYLEGLPSRYMFSCDLGTGKSAMSIVHYIRRAYPQPLLILAPASKLLYRDWETDRKSTRLNSSHSAKSRMPSSA